MADWRFLCLGYAQVGVGAVLAHWMAVYADFGADAEAEARSEAAALIGTAEEDERSKIERLLRERIADQLQASDPALALYHLGDKKLRHTYPQWVPAIGGFKRALLACVLANVALLVLYADVVRAPNYFELVGLPPFQMQNPNFGVHVYHVAKRSQEQLQAGGLWGMDRNATKKVFQVLQDGKLRAAYDLFGKTDGLGEMATLSGLAIGQIGVILVYVVWAWVYVLVCSADRRFELALPTGLTALGVVFFLDVSVLVSLSTLYDNAALAVLPTTAWLATFERLWLVRTFAVAPMLVGVLFYYSHKYVPYEEHSLEYLITLLIESLKTERSMEMCQEACQKRRELREQIVETVRKSEKARMPLTGDANNAKGATRRRARKPAGNNPTS